MQLADVNILVNAHRPDEEHHALCRRWLGATVNGDESFGFSDLVASSVIRIVTNRKIFAEPTSMVEALAFVQNLRDRENCVVVAPQERHWTIFERLCQQTDVRGNLVTDAYFAALAIESGSEWISLDGDFARFPGLRWRRPSV
jgi:toxin-antitoxin system PIN domain toxin